MTETREDYVRKIEGHMRDKGEWPKEPSLDEQMREMLRRQWRANQPAEVPELTDREVSMLNALRAAYQTLMVAHMEKTRGYQAVRACLDKHDPRPPPDREQMALWTEPWPDEDAG